MKKFLIFLFSLSFIFSISVKGLASSALDFVPIVGNIKSLGEAITGKDIDTGEELSGWKEHYRFWELFQVEII